MIHLERVLSKSKMFFFLLIFSLILKLRITNEMSVSHLRVKRSKRNIKLIKKKQIEHKHRERERKKRIMSKLLLKWRRCYYFKIFIACDKNFVRRSTSNILHRLPSPAASTRNWQPTKTPYIIELFLLVFRLEQSFWCDSGWRQRQHFGSLSPVLSVWVYFCQDVGFFHGRLIRSDSSRHMCLMSQQWISVDSSLNWWISFLSRHKRQKNSQAGVIRRKSLSYIRW